MDSKVKLRTVKRGIGVAIVLLALTGCKSATKIHEITSHPEKFDGHQVTLDGTVSTISSVNDNDASKGGTFVIYDCTGYIKVITHKELPLKCDRVYVGGIVQVTKNDDGAAPTVEIVGDYIPQANSEHFAYGPLPKEYGN